MSCLHRRNPSVVWQILFSSSSSFFQRLCEAPMYFTAVWLWLQQLWPWDIEAPTICPSLRLESGGASPRGAPAMQQSWRMGGEGVVLVVCERGLEVVGRREGGREGGKAGWGSRTAKRTGVGLGRWTGEKKTTHVEIVAVTFCEKDLKRKKEKKLTAISKKQEF